MFISTSDPWLHGRVAELEQENEDAWHLLRILTEHLRTTQGEQALPPALRAFLAANDPTREAELSRHIAEARAQKTPSSRRALRERLGITWDEVDALLHQWPGSAVWRARFLQRILVRQALASGG